MRGLYLKKAKKIEKEVAGTARYYGRMQLKAEKKEIKSTEKLVDVLNRQSRKMVI